MKQIDETGLLHRMAAYCSMAERCIQDVQKKIRTAGLPAEAGERIVALLLQERFIDEKRFARSFVNDKLRFNKWGRNRIAYELSRKDIPPDICREALEAIDGAAYSATLLSLLEEKRKTFLRKDGPEAFKQLFRFAAGRGFESGEIAGCLRRLFNGNDYADGYME
jgi:regulatory protein